MVEVIRVKNISKSFGKKAIFSDVSCSINQSDLVAIIGPSGVGKSVFLKILIGFIKPSSGSVSTSAHIAFSAQANSLYESLTVKQNLLYFSKLYGVENKADTISNVINMLQIQEFENILVSKLSGGTKKRVDIACALLEDPDILVLDEPFTGLDYVLVKRLSSFLKGLSDYGKTIIISSHKLDQMGELCNRFFVFNDQKLAEISKREFNRLYLGKDS